MSQTPLYLTLMRHAKSSWSDGSLTDHERPLNKRGQKAATLMGEVLTAKGYAPDIIWSSDSKRTRETAMRLIRAIPGAQTINYNPDFYHASPDVVIKACEAVDAPTQNLMLLGHNPGWGGLYYYMTKREHDFPTAACAVFKSIKPLSENWFSPDNWKIVELLLPRDLE